ncbi:MAG: alanine/glycine:cation symporter family protein [Flavobacteriaceae bacterium]|nr:alanine/glycine:cation symporter family protein [Flavobacteriaceae bacterium]
MEIIISKINDIVWSQAMIVLCVCTGLYFSFRTGFLQFTYLRQMLKLLFQEKTTDKGISPFQAFALAISGRVGTGNIVGVATAIAMGGPGAIFWMWLIAIFGSASAFVEATLGQIYKKEMNGEYRGGPAFYIEKGLGIKWYAMLFAIITAVGCGMFLPGIQSNSIASSMSNAFGISTNTDFGVPINVMGVIIVFLLALIIFGGVKRLSKVAEMIVPIMAGAYILIGLTIIGLNFKQIPDVFSLIISSAMGQDAVFGGILGSAISWGVKRGIYSNEAGQGSTPHVAAAAAVGHPVEQGLVQAFSVYVDTLFVCSTTAFMILFTNQYNVMDEHTQTLIVENVKGIDYTAFTQSAISFHFPSFGQEFVAVALFFFAFTTIIAYYYYAETNVAYLVCAKHFKPAVFILRILFLVGIYMGSVKEAKLVWAIGDIGVGLMAWVNLIAILGLGNVVIKVWKDYKAQKKQGVKNPVFDVEKLNIKNAEYWEKK